MRAGRLFCSFCGTHRVESRQLTRVTFDGPGGPEDWEACPLCLARIRKTIYETFNKLQSEREKPLRTEP